MTLATIKAYYASGKWSAAKLKLLVKSGVLTESQYAEITGEDYSA